MPAGSPGCDSESELSRSYIDRVSGRGTVGVRGEASRFETFLKRIASLECGAGVRLNVTWRCVDRVGVTGACLVFVLDEPTRGCSTVSIT
jgi:hypothetical protein